MLKVRVVSLYLSLVRKKYSILARSKVIAYCNTSCANNLYNLVRDYVKMNNMKLNCNTKMTYFSVERLIIRKEHNVISDHVP